MTILFPTDFSDRATKALDEAIGFAERFKAKLIILHLYHRPVSGKTSSQEMVKSRLLKLEMDIDDQFKEIKEQNEKLATISYEFRKSLGVSTEGIINTAHYEDIDLIIMATKGANGFGEIWGTKTAHIVKEVKVPVLVIPDDTTLDINKVCLACDYSDGTDYEALNLLAKITKEMSMDVNVVTLNTEEKDLTDHQLVQRDKVKELLLSAPIAFEFTFNQHKEIGIINHCQANKAGMIAILPKHYSFIEWLFHDSLTEKMVFHSPVPLLVLK
ncbi:MAG: universal stress protein [Bacteroidota bacterium]